MISNRELKEEIEQLTEHNKALSDELKQLKELVKKQAEDQNQQQDNHGSRNQGNDQAGQQNQQNNQQDNQQNNQQQNQQQGVSIANIANEFLQLKGLTSQLESKMNNFISSQTGGNQLKQEDVTYLILNMMNAMIDWTIEYAASRGQGQN